MASSISIVDDGWMRLLSLCESTTSRGWHRRGLNIKNTEPCDDNWKDSHGLGTQPCKGNGLCTR